MQRRTWRWMGSGALLGLCACQVELDTTLDILPQRYPNRLAPGEQELEAVLLRPKDALAAPEAAQALARAGDTGSSSVEVPGSVAFRDVDADGNEDAVVRFSVDALREAGLLGGSSHLLEVRLQGLDGAWVGSDRVFEPDAALVELPEPSGPFAVGTAALVVHDATRPGGDGRGRALLLRLWYPAQPSTAQPAPYFLDPEHARQNLRAGPLPLPDDLFERTHGFARAAAPAAAPEPRAALLLSTAWSAPVESYSALAEELASRGDVVVGVNHPNGSGAVVYPDGSGPELDPAAVVPDALNHEQWALDLEYLAALLARDPVALGNLAESGGIQLPRPVRAALAQVDPVRIAALGHSFGGSAALRADADSDFIAASADLDGALLGDAAELAARTRALVLLSPDDLGADPSLDEYAASASTDSRVYAIGGSRYANFADQSWLYTQLLEESPDLGREGYGLGSIAPERAHQIVSGLVHTFFAETLSGAARSAPQEATFPEVSRR